jgi:hypothetical protein
VSRVLQPRPATLARMTARLLSLTVCALVVAALAGPTAGSQSRPRSGAQPTVVVETARDGFHWGDAAIGAAATLGIVLAAAGVLLVRRDAVPPTPRPERNGP